MYFSVILYHIRERIAAKPKRPEYQNAKKKSEESLCYGCEGTGVRWSSHWEREKKAQAVMRRTERLRKREEKEQSESKSEDPGLG